MSRFVMVAATLLAATMFIACAESTGSPESDTSGLIVSLLSADSKATIVELSFNDESRIGALKWPSFSPNGRLFAAVDARTGSVHVFDVRSGELHTSIRPGVWLTDSLLPHLVATQRRWKAGDTLVARTDWRYPDGDPVSLDEQTRVLGNRYQSAVFLSDTELLISASVSAVGRNANGELFGFGTTCLTRFRTDGKLRGFHAIRTDGEVYWPQPRSLATLDDDRVLLYSFRDTILPGSTPDTIHTLSVIGPHGDRLGEVGAIPEDHFHSGLAYDLLEVFPCVTGKTLRIAYSTSDCVFDGTGGRTRIAGLALTNAGLFREVRQSRTELDSLIFLEQFRIQGLFADSSGQLIIAWLDERTRADSVHVVRQDLAGKELSHLSFARRCGSEIVKSFGFDRTSNRFAVLAAHGSGRWRMYLLTLG